MTRLRYLEANIWELFIVLLVAITVANYFLSPPRGGVHSPEAYWNVLYGAGAMVITLGLIILSPRLEGAGLSLFAGGAIVNLLRVAQLGGRSAWLQVLILALFALAAMIRSYTIIRILRVPR